MTGVGIRVLVKSRFRNVRFHWGGYRTLLDRSLTNFQPDDARDRSRWLCTSHFFRTHRRSSENVSERFIT